MSKIIKIPSIRNNPTFKGIAIRLHSRLALQINIIELGINIRNKQTATAINGLHNKNIAKSFSL